MQGLLANPVVQGLLTDPNTLRARARQEAAQMMPRAGGGMIGAPSPQQPQNAGWDRALSSIGNSGAKLIEGIQANKIKEQEDAQIAAFIKTQPPERQEQLAALASTPAGRAQLMDGIAKQAFPEGPSEFVNVFNPNTKESMAIPKGTRPPQGYVLAGAASVPTTDPNKPFNPDGTPNQAYMEYQRQLREAGRSSNNTTVNNVTETESEFDKVLGKNLGAEFTGVQTASAAAQDTINRVNTARSYLDKIETGAITPTLVGAKALAKSFGINLESLGLRDDVAPAEAFRAVTGQFLMDYIQQTKGSISESENKLFASFSPSLANTKEGNKFLLDIAARKAKRDRDLATFANQYAKENGRLDIDWYDAKDEWLRKNTIATEEVLNRYEALGGSSSDTLGNTAVPTPGVSGSGQMGRGDWSIRKVD